MKIRFLKNITAPVKSTWHHDDSCGCSGDEWVDQWFPAGEETDASVDQSAFTYQDGTVDVSKLTFNEDYTIIEFP
jgi:hypothetical protein